MGCRAPNLLCRHPSDEIHMCRWRAGRWPRGLAAPTKPAPATPMHMLSLPASLCVCCRCLSYACVVTALPVRMRVPLLTLCIASAATEVVREKDHRADGLRRLPCGWLRVGLSQLCGSRLCYRLARAGALALLPAAEIFNIFILRISTF